MPVARGLPSTDGVCCEHDPKSCQDQAKCGELARRLFFHDQCSGLDMLFSDAQPRAGSLWLLQ